MVAGASLSAGGYGENISRCNVLCAGGDAYALRGGGPRRVSELITSICQ
jgi:hypothetical protein